MKKRIIAFFLIIVCKNSIFAQSVFPSNFSFTSYTTTDGLCGNEVVKTIKDKKGFLWIATHNGLSRFDGNQFKTYTYVPGDSTSLRSIWITDLLLDDDKTLWVTTEWGFCWYDEVFDRFRYINNKNELTVLYKAPLALGTSGTIWVACEDGLYKINSKTKTLSKTSISRIADPQSVSEDNKNNIWIATRGHGLIMFNPKDNKEQIFSNKQMPSEAHYMQLYTDSDCVWIATSEGLLCVKNDGTSNLFSQGVIMLQNKICDQLTTVASFEEDKLICGTYDKRLLLFDKSINKFVYQWQSDKNLPLAAYTNIFTNNNFIWLSTQSGLYKMQKGYSNFELVNLPNAKNKTLYKKILVDKNDSNKYWLLDGEKTPSLTLFDNAKHVIIKTANCKSATNTAYNKSAFLQLQDGTVYVFVNKYINIFDAKGNWKAEIEAKEKIYSACLNAANKIWLGTESGIASFDEIKKTIQYFPITFSGTDIENKSFAEPFPVTGISTNSEGIIWIASIKYGLFSYEIKTNKFTSHRQISSTSYDPLNRSSSVIAAKDSIWVGTMAGLSLFIPSKNKFVNYNSSNGLQCSYVYSIVETFGAFIWGRGNDGVFNFNIRASKFTNYRLQPSFDVFYYEQRLSAVNNKPMLGLINSFAIFDNTNLETKKIETIITDAMVNDKHIYKNQEINKLSYNQNNVRFDFTSINFDNEPQTFYYKLDGLNNNWIEATGKNNILFTNLAAGKYLFSVKTKRLKDNSFGNAATYPFEIKAAFWQTLWFKLLCAILFVMAIIYIAIRSVAGIRKKEKEKTEVNKIMAELETKLLRSQMNPHFIFNSLNSIQKYIWENKEEDAAEYLSMFAKLIRAILENSRKEFILLKDEMATMKLYIELEHRRSNGQFDYNIKTDINLEQDKTLIPPMIMQPFIENAIWHGLNKKLLKGKLLVSVSKENNKLVCIIDDDGVGRQMTEPIIENKKSLGIEITQQRIQQLMNTTHEEASVEIVDKKDDNIATGTTVKITLPLKKM